MRQVINFIYLKRRYADALISNGAGDVPTQVFLADDSVCAYRSVDRVLGPSTRATARSDTTDNVIAVGDATNSINFATCHSRNLTSSYVLYAVYVRPTDCYQITSVTSTSDSWMMTTQQASTARCTQWHHKSSGGRGTDDVHDFLARLNASAHLIT